MTYLKRAKQLLKDVKVEGCLIHEIVDLEKQLGIYLPEAYKEFLLWMGKNPDVFLLGSEVEYNSLIKIQGWANELLKEKELEPLPSNAFVFYMHQGYQFSYFLLGQSEDPQVYFFDEGITKEVKSLDVPYSQWIATEAEIHCEFERAKNYELN